MSSESRVGLVRARLEELGFNPAEFKLPEIARDMARQYDTGTRPADLDEEEFTALARPRAIWR